MINSQTFYILKYIVDIVINIFVSNLQIAFRSGTSTRLDDRIFAMFQLKTLPLAQLIQVVYPDLYPVHILDDRNAKDIDGKVCPQPPRLNLSAEKLDSRGIFLMDAGDRIFIYVGKNINPIFCSNMFGVTGFASIPEEMVNVLSLFLGYASITKKIRKFTIYNF